jgi:pyridoxal phosphate enzyme (YggS family)
MRLYRQTVHRRIEPGQSVCCPYDRNLPLEEVSLRDRLTGVENRIAQALERSGRKRSDITLVAVSKKFSAQRIREAYAAGLREFGENYVQEFAGKRPELADLPETRFHLIGHLQSNKARQASELFQVVETVDSPKLLRRLDGVAGELQAAVEVLFEVKLSQEESKTGALPEQLPDLVRAAEECPQLTISGLMTVPPWSKNPEDSRPYFRKLAALSRQYGFSTLSMGMSGDFEVAIEEGATTIRVGTALFGARPKPSAVANT